MSKRVIIIGSIVSVVLILILVNGKSKIEPAKISGTFRDLIKSGENLECSFNKSDAVSGDMAGKIFVSEDGKLRGEYKLTDTNRQKYDLELVHDGEFNYMWGDTPNGLIALKTKIGVDEFNNAYVNFIESSQDLGFDCKPWINQSSFFVTPINIVFNEIDIPNTDQLNTTDISNVCATCDLLEAGSTRDQCLKTISTLGC